MPEQGCFVVGAGSAVFLETSVAEAEGIGSTTVGGKLLDSPRDMASAWQGQGAGGLRRGKDAFLDQLLPELNTMIDIDFHDADGGTALRR